MTAVLSHWRATYAAGDWIVLAGPSSVVVLQPFADEWSAMVSTLWNEVVASASLTELAGKLAGYGIDQMPHFGAFFWTASGMRSLVRGAVRVVDPDSGMTLADGTGVQTWTEIGLGDITRIRVETPDTVETVAAELPLVVGAVRASTVTLDAGPDAAVRSPQGVVAGGEPAPDAGDLVQDPGWDPAPEVAEMENADTELMQLPFPDTAGLPAAPPEPEPEPEPQPAVARVVLSNGSSFDLDGPIRIGRAPSPSGEDEGDVLLVTVSSPNQDISRTHLLVVPGQDQVAVTDLHSTNGTILVRPGSGLERENLNPGQALLVPMGSLLELGEGISVLIEPPTESPA